MALNVNFGEFCNLNLCFNDSVFMRIVTWNRDSHGLFDYESKERDRVQLEFKSSTGAVIARNSTSGEVTLENPFVSD